VEWSCAFSSVGNGIVGPRATTTRATTAPLALSSRSTVEASAAAPAVPVQKVAIIGAGIAGLSLAHSLRSTHLRENNGENNTTPPIQIDIFDSRSDLDEKSGSGIQLTGGMAALRRISPALQRSVSEASLPLERVVSKCRPWFGSDEMGWKILELDIQELIREKAAAAAQQEVDEGQSQSRDGQCELVTEEGEVLAYTILRGALQRILLEGLMQEHGIEVQFDKRLNGISYSDVGAEEGIECQFMDGSKTGPYDLVIGCDGIQSAVKQYVDTGKIQSSDGDYSQSSAIYSGLRITFAIQENVGVDEAAIDGCQFTQLLGNGAYALTSSYGTGKGMPRAKGAFLVYPDENYIGPFPRANSIGDESNDVGSATSATSVDANDPVPLDENADWTQDKRVTRDHVTECLKILQSASIPGDDVSNIIQNSDRFFDLGVYLHNPFSWNGWVREVSRSGSQSGLFGAFGDDKTAKFAITTGDAAHAMPPFLGQGANQALQDSCSLAAKILEYNSQVQHTLDLNDPSSKPDLKTLLKEYESRRWLPTTSITAKAAFLGYLEVGPSLFSNFRDVFFFVMGKIGVVRKVFLDAATPKM
ncbi:hypothetical protein ACHAXR_004961, partial [Thalassiosira sp. AJA248-18]